MSRSISFPGFQRSDTRKIVRLKKISYIEENNGLVTVYYTVKASNPGSPYFQYSFKSDTTPEEIRAIRSALPKLKLPKFEVLTWDRFVLKALEESDRVELKRQRKAEEKVSKSSKSKKLQEVA